MAQVSVLSVGSDETLLYARNEVLHQNGFQVTSVRNRHEAVLACKSDSFDLALLCHSIPQEEAERLARDLEVIAPSVQVVNLGAWDHVGLVEIRKPEFLLQILQSLLASGDGHGDGHFLAQPGKGDGHAGRAIGAQRGKSKAPRAINDPGTAQPGRGPATRPSDPEQQ